ncbi:hypothetical protein PENSPDRAFT_660526 [Peniophora sp. CONT]|nr:hypothetical protein PENSPDRAFT_660526 [Peniophora sp. CONT]
MRAKLTQALFAAYPALYRGRVLSVRENLMSYGFACGDGWYPIIDRLSTTLTRHIGELPVEKRDDYYAFQVKEKFGALRFYMTRSTQEMEDAISAAAQESLRTCEECGEPGETNDEGRE